MTVFYRNLIINFAYRSPVNIEAPPLSSRKCCSQMYCNRQRLSIIEYRNPTCKLLVLDIVSCKKFTITFYMRGRGVLTLKDNLSWYLDKNIWNICYYKEDSIPDNQSTVDSRAWWYAGRTCGRIASRKCAFPRCGSRRDLRLEMDYGRTTVSIGYGKVWMWLGPERNKPPYPQGQ